tara:strand:- start:1381 stop:1587 length:207 start_codon:yes stop_codon:yes gene_type:complete
MNCKYCKDKLVKGDNANNDSDVICVQCSEEGYSVWVNSTVEEKEEIFNCLDYIIRYNESKERKENDNR